MSLQANPAQSNSRQNQLGFGAFKVGRYKGIEKECQVLAKAVECLPEGATAEPIEKGRTMLYKITGKDIKQENGIIEYFINKLGLTRIEREEQAVINQGPTEDIFEKLKQL